MHKKLFHLDIACKSHRGSKFFLGTLNRGLKETEKIEGTSCRKLRCLKYDVQPPDTFVTIDAQQDRYLYSV